MGKQIPLFKAPPPDANDAINARIAERRAERMGREASKPGSLAARFHRAYTPPERGEEAPPVAEVTAVAEPPPPAESGVVAVEPPATREQRRSRRKRDVRARTVSIRRMTKRELELGRMLYPTLDEEEAALRPRTRADCAGVPRPCPFVSCRHHLYLDVSARTGAIKLNFPDLDPDELPAEKSCALDVADRDGVTLEEAGAIMNLTRERIRQVEVKALAKMQAANELLALRDFHGEGPIGKRRLPVLEQSEPEDDGGRFQGDEDAETGTDFDAAEFASVALDAE